MSNNELFASVTPMQTLAIVQEDLFPKEMITSSNAYSYISLVFKHSRVTEEDKHFLRNGTKWLNEEAVLKYKKVYTKLLAKERQNVLEAIAQESWGESWIKTVLSYILEATLGDPIYGINKNKSGWKWLNHTSGLPRPKERYL
ncbi:gluconate 2-dehydrogenase subunit 3 family protein [Sulfurimonas sp.]|uniref:gluconate 2-dehydrogenase subunit 3 family protein n=1 Tax=Sulfurimonas sp. TaxID=2022749 RepID=UPI0039E5E4EC